MQQTLTDADRSVARFVLEHKMVAADALRRSLQRAAKEGLSLRGVLIEEGLVREDELGAPREEEAAGAEAAGPAGNAGTGDLESSSTSSASTAAASPSTSGSGYRRKRLGEYLVDEGTITAAQLEEAIQLASEKNVLLGNALVTLQFLSEEQLAEAMIRHSAETRKQSSRHQRLRLGDILLEQKTVTQEQLDEALAYSKKQRMRLGESLVAMGVVKEVEIAMALSRQMAIPYVNLAKNPPDPALLKKVPRRMCMKNQVIPFRLEGKMLTVAIVDPLNVLALDDIQNVTGFTVLPVIVTKTDFDSASRNFLGVGDTEDLLELIKEDDSDRSLDESGLGEADAPIVNLINKIVGQAVMKGASDIHFDPGEQTLRIRFRIDGVLRDVTTAPPEIAPAISSRFKVMCGLDIAETRLPQDGKFRLSIESRKIDFRVAILPLISGEKIVIRLLDQSRGMTKMGALGMEPQAFEDFKWAVHVPNGIVLVTGPTGSGKSTTLYAALQDIIDPKINIHTAEDPVEFNMPGVIQVPVKPDIGLTFAAALRSFLRQDPDVILLGEIRDVETAQIAMKAAMTGHLVLSTLHTNDAVSTIDRLITMGTDRFIVGSAVRVILAQRLVRSLCEGCREEDPEASPARLREMGVTDRILSESGVEQPLEDIKVYRAVGCNQCEAGYRGRLGIYEVLRMNEELREAIVLGASNFDLQEMACKAGMLTLRESALCKVLQGVTSIEEVERLTVTSLSKEGRGQYRLGEIAPGSEADEREGLLPSGAPSSARMSFEEVASRLAQLAEVVSPLDLSRPLSRVSRLCLQLGNGTGPALPDGTRAVPSEELERLQLYLATLSEFTSSPRGERSSVEVRPWVETTLIQRLPELARQAYLVAGRSASVERLDLRIVLPEDGRTVELDAAVLECALRHLLVNALAALPDGGKLRFAAGPSAEDPALEEFSVLDNGPGIPEELGAIRQPCITGTLHGLGLGLAIVERCAGLLGGRLEVRSKPGKGCLARLLLPRSPQPQRRYERYDPQL